MKVNDRSGQILIDASTRFFMIAAVELLAKRIADRLKTHKFCTVFENELQRVWPNAPVDPRIALIEKFARKHGWMVTVQNPGLRAVFRKMPDGRGSAGGPN